MYIFYFVNSYYIGKVGFFYKEIKCLLNFKRGVFISLMVWECWNGEIYFYDIIMKWFE